MGEHLAMGIDTREAESGLRELLALSGIYPLSVSRVSDFFVIRAETTSIPRYCPKCQGSRIESYASKEQIIHDRPRLGVPTVISLNRKTFRCQHCRAIFAADVANINEKWQATNRLVNYVEGHGIANDFDTLSRETGLPPRTLQEILEQYVERLRDVYKFHTPRCIGIAEIKIIGRRRIVVANVNKKTLIDILASNNEELLVRYLTSLTNRHHIEWAAIGFRPHLRHALQLALPSAQIVVDKNDVFALVSDALEKLYATIRSSFTSPSHFNRVRERRLMHTRSFDLSLHDQIILRECEDKCPLLVRGYETKERFYDIWNCKCRKEAEAAYRQWRTTLPEELLPYLIHAIDAINDWSQSIFNYFDHPISREYMTALQIIERKINRMDLTTSFSHFRAQVLYELDPNRVDHSHIVTSSASILASQRRSGENNDSDIMEPPANFRSHSYGPFLSALQAKLDSGYFKASL